MRHINGQLSAAFLLNNSWNDLVHGARAERFDVIAIEDRGLLMDLTDTTIK